MNFKIVICKLCECFKKSFNIIFNDFRWNFWTDNNDICFGIYRQTDAGKKSQNVQDMIQVVEPSRVNSHLVPEFGWIICDEPGICECI